MWVKPTETANVGGGGGGGGDAAGAKRDPRDYDDRAQRGSAVRHSDDGGGRSHSGPDAGGDRGHSGGYVACAHRELACGLLFEQYTDSVSTAVRSRAQPDRSKRVFVGNLSFKTTSADLKVSCWCRPLLHFHFAVHDCYSARGKCQ